MEEVVERDRVAVELVSRVQVRAVLSGLVVAAGVYAMCMGFSWAIGLSTFQPTVDHARGLALGNVIWGAIAGWISIFFGGYVAALVGRSSDARSGVLHGLVVWGATAAIFGLLIAFVFGGVLGTILQMGVTGNLPAIGPARLDTLRQAAGLTVWLYWAGIVGGLFTSILGGFLGARSEIRAPRRVGARVPVGPGVPHPA
jgi:hypothetical protein